MINRLSHFDAFLTVLHKRLLPDKEIIYFNPGILIINFAIVLMGLSLAVYSPNPASMSSSTSAAMYASSPGNPTPLVAISTPIKGAAFTAPADITIYATASDIRGRVTKVDFYEDSNLLGTDMSWPYSYKWQNVPAGTYNLFVVATNDSGLTSFSQIVNVAVRDDFAGGCTCPVGCESRTVISPPFSMDGTGEFCWETSSLGRFVISWRLDTLEINAVNMKNRSTNSFPPKIDGKYYIYYKSSDPYGHFELR
jgi:hypothetical protein